MSEVRGILFAHGAMAEGMVDALRRISGVPEDAVVPLSNEGLGPEELGRAVDAAAGDGPVVIFTDLLSGSCAMAAQISCGNRRTRAVVCGVNLPMLLDFVFHRDMPLDELVVRLVDKAKDAIRVPVSP